MHHQFYDNEEDFEPRVVPKPITKPECLTVPIVPEISLIFEKPVVQNLDNGNTNSSSKAQAKLMKSAQFCGNMTECHNSVLPILDNNNSYAIWKQRKYSQRINSADATDISPSYKNASNRNHISQSLQDPSIQNHQETDKIYDTQNTLINAGSNNGKYEKNVKFKCSNVDNSDDLVREKQFSYGKQLSSCNSLQRTSNVIMRTKRIPNDANSSSSNKNELLACTEHPYSTIDINAYPFQQFYIPNYSNCNTDNNETIKTLLQLVNSQSEQIKNLQLQVNRLVQMQERSFRNKSTCVDSSLFATQTCDHSPTNYYSTTHTCNSCSQKAEIQNIKKNRHHTSIVEKRNLENYENKNDNKLEVTLEPKSQKAFVEQKVSIGVMTSFEFTVQNNPLLIDSEVYNKKEAPKECNDVNKKNYITSYDSIESAKKCRNQFALKSGTAQLENIVEDTESYLSSNQQQSSDFNTGSSVKDSERHTYVHCPKQLDIYNTTDILESSKTYPQHAANLNQERTNDGMYITYNKIEEQIQNAKKASRMSMHVDHDSVENENCNKMFVNKTNDHSIVDVEKNKDKIMINTDKYRDSASNISVTNHCKNHREHDVKQINSVGDSIMLSRGDFKILERPPTPEPSIHVEMQEYSTDDESDKPKRSSKIGWTFYNNVLGQVNEILQNSGVIDNQDQNNTKIHHVEQKNDTETRTALKTVKATTLEQLRRLGISLSENNEYRESNNKTLDFDTSFYPRLECRANMTQATSVNDTNTSMQMKALALKYLSDEQLTDVALQKQGTSSLKHFMLSNLQGTNMSFATMRYLERYQLLPGRNNAQIAETNRIPGEITSKHENKPTNTKNNPTVDGLPLVQTSRTTCPSRILDISTLKQQPKLL